MVALLYHVSGEALPEADRPDPQLHFETEENIARLVDHIRAHGIDLTPVNAADDEWPDLVADHQVFNYTYGSGLRAESVRPTLVLEAAETDYLGAPLSGLYLSANKPHAAELMSSVGFQCPRHRLVCAPVGAAAATALSRHFDGCPYLALAPAYENAGPALVRNDPDALVSAVADLFGHRPGPMLIREHLDGSDITVPVVGRSQPRCLPAVNLARAPAGAGRASAVDRRWTSMGDWPPEVRQTVYRMAVRAFELTGQRDYARLHARVTPDGRCYFLEMNANPRLGLGAAAFAVSAAAAGMTVGDVFQAILQDSALPYGLSPAEVGL